MPDPAVVGVMNGFRNDLIARETQQFNQMADRWIELERDIEDSILRLAQDVADAGGTPTPGQLARMRRYQGLIQQIQEELDRYVIELVPIIRGEQTIYGQAGKDSALEAVQSQGVTSGWNTLPKEAIENMVGLAGDGSPLRELLRQSYPDAIGRLASILIQGTALGRNPRETARLMRNATRGALNRMMVIARTEQLRVYRTAALDSYRANSDIVQGYVRLCAKQSRTCLGCLADDGSFYTLDEVMPEHPQGRCSMVPSVRGRGQLTFTTGAQWFAAQPRETQLRIAGPERLALLEAGRIDFADLKARKENATWGPSIQPATLEDLAGRRGRPAA